MNNQIEEIPFATIIKAIHGDEDALGSVVYHYRNYIRALSLRPATDEFGNEYVLVDESMRIRVETKLITSIISGFKVLPT